MEITLSRSLERNADELQRLADHLRNAGFWLQALLIGAAALAFRDEVKRNSATSAADEPSHSVESTTMPGSPESSWPAAGPCRGRRPRIKGMMNEKP